MKRLLVILLVFALLLPMGTVAQAEEVETKPFFLVNWTDFESDLTNTYRMAYFWSNASKIEQGVANVSWNGVSDIPELAEALKEEFDSRPEGARVINFCMVHDAVHGLVEDACILDKAIPLVSGWLEEFLAEYSRIGGKLDGLFVVVQYMPIYSSYIHGEFFSEDPLIYNKIVNNPVYQEKIRPKLVERGFKFYPNPNEHTPEIYSIHPNSGSEYAQSRSIWDAVMRSYLGQTVTDCCAPLWKYYPDAIVSDYQSKDVKPWLKEMSEGGGAIGGGGIQTTAGNASNDNFSFDRPDDSFFTSTSTNGPVYRTIPGYTNAVYEHTVFNRFLFDINVAKNTYLASDTGNLTYWVNHAYNSKYSESPYYAETLLHLGMVDPKAYHGYIVPQDAGDKYETALQIVDDCLRDLTRIVGAADRKPISVDPSWNHQFVLSGMYAGGKNYWRLTPDNTKVSLEDFKVEGADPTFSVGGETVTFPQGKIIETGEVREVGTCGYWIETPADVTPVITRPENYFREYPAFGETFESYEAGTEYNYNNALPATCWEVKKSGGGSGIVVADGDGKALAVKGTFTAKNVNMPENITAGDTYAENQAWEVSFTLPADMAADAELVLLNVTNEKKKTNDGGFKISGGKVYYSQAGEYVELAGVELTAGTKYTVVRDMDFSVEDAYTSDYYVYSAQGELLGKAMDIPTDVINLPVYSISIGCTKVAGEAVLLDDYKLYPTSVATDYELYDANTGIKVTELDKAREGDTAYRLSWLNATDKEKTYSVVAAYYNGETLVSEKVVQEVKMAPNGDGVLTGIVKNETEGQTMLVYLRDDNPAENANDTNSDAGNESKPDSKLIIIIAAVAAVVVIAVIVIVVVASAKKKKKTAE